MIEFKNLTEIGAARWKAVETYDFLSALPYVPVSDTELVLSAHYFPIAILYADGAPEVVAILEPGFQRSRLVDSRGRWQRDYVPIALRSLPFRLHGQLGAEPQLQVTSDLGLTGGDGRPFFQPDGSLTRDLKTIRAMLAKLQAGRERLKTAAERLILADLLSPLVAPGRGVASAPLLTVAARQVERLTGKRAAALTCEGISELDLAMACLFSQRHFNDAVTWAPEVSTTDGPSVPAVEILIKGMENLPVILDSSELFSIDLLESE